MEDLDFSDSPYLTSRLHFHPVVVVVFFCGLFFLALGAGVFFFTKERQSDVQIISSDIEKGAYIFVDVGGAVARPGVYKIGGDLRIGGAISAAGGMTAEADSSKVNLAAKVTDGQKIYVPVKQEQQIQNSKAKSQNGGEVAGATFLISINSASAEELDTLPGVGPATAQKIVAGRPYTSTEDLLAKKAVSSAVYEKIKALITF